MKVLIISLIVFILCDIHGYGQSVDSVQQNIERQSVYTDPLLPFFGLYIVNYGLRYNQLNEGIYGIVASKATTTPSKYLEYPGYVNSFGVNIGHRFYLIKGLHFDVWFMPALNSIYEENQQKFYNSYSLYNEYRIGYKFDIFLWNTPFLLNFQWPIGFSLYDSNRPDSFKEIDKKDPVFYLYFPNIWVGYRF